MRSNTCLPGVNVLDQIKAGQAEKPEVVKILRLPDILSWEPGRITTQWEVDPDFYTTGGQLFGGYIGALADQVLGHTALTVLDDNCVFRTVQTSLSYYEPIRHGMIRIEGKVVRRGRQVIHATADFYDQRDRLLCSANCVQMIIPITSDAPAETQ